MPAFSDIEENLIRVVGLKLRDFRGFSFLDLQLEQDKPVNVFIADNGGGKTTILDAVAGFLSDFLNRVIFGDNDTHNQTAKTAWRSKDVKNDQEVAYCNVALELTYQYPALELLETIADITDFLNEYELEGQIAQLYLKKSKSGDGADDYLWDLLLDKDEDDLDKPDLLPKEILYRLDELSKASSKKSSTLEDDRGESTIRKLSPEDKFIVARKTPKGWVGNTHLKEVIKEYQKLTILGYWIWK